MPSIKDMSSKTLNRHIMDTPHSYVIHIREEVNDLPISLSVICLDGSEEQSHEQVPRRKKRCWEPPMFFSLSKLITQPLKKFKNY